MVGDHLVEVVCSGTSMLEYMNQDGLMLAVYENGLAAEPNNRWLSRIVAQIAHRYPGIHILEIGQYCYFPMYWPLAKELTFCRSWNGRIDQDNFARSRLSFRNLYFH